MQEFFGLAYYAEVPAVIFDIQRGGHFDRHADTHAAVRHPARGLCERNGDTKHVLLFPQLPAQSFEFAAQALRSSAERQLL